MKKTFTILICFLLLVDFAGTIVASNAEMSTEARLVGTYIDDTLPVEDIIPELIPNQDGLYPHEILAIEYAEKYYTDEESFPDFWWYECGVNDVKALLNRLMDKGYISVGSLNDSLQLYKVDELKQVLREYGLKVSGNKTNLIKRLVENIQEEELRTLFPHASYKTTEKGKEAILYDEYVLYAHTHQFEGINIYSLNQMLNGQTQNYKEVVWEHLVLESELHLYDEDFGLYRNTRLEMARFMAEENNYEEALKLLAEVSYWDTSGMDNSGLDIELSGKYWFPYDDDHIFIRMAPGIIELYKKWKRNSGIAEERFRQIIWERISNLSAPFHVFTKEEVMEIILMELDGDTTNLKKLYEVAKERLQKRYPMVDF